MTHKKIKIAADHAATQRIAEINQLYQDLRALCQRLMAEAGAPDGVTPKQLLAKMSEITSAHLLVLKAEEAFHEKHNATQCTGQAAQDDIDLEQIRSELAARLARLHDSCQKAGVSK